jgi:hypothetical protein
MKIRDARANVMKAIQVVKKLVVAANTIAEREKYVDLHEALHRELAKLDTIALSENNREYQALTLRFASAKNELEAAAKRAKQLAAGLGLAANVIDSLTKLAAVL